MATRGELLLLLRKQPGITVAELAKHLGLSTMGVRRHIDALAAAGLVERNARDGRRVGRPAAGWRLTDTGIELFPRRYERFALDLLDDIAERGGPEAVTAVLSARTEKEAPAYLEALSDAANLRDRVHRLAALRDEAGYVAEARTADEGELLIEHNCALHRAAEQHPEVCAQELDLFRRVLGPGVEVTRVSHTMNGDARCEYCIRSVT